MSKLIECFIKDIKIGERLRIETGDLTNLVASIKELGLMHPIVIDDKRNLIAGFRRLSAWKLLQKEDKAKYSMIPCHVLNIKDALMGEFHENTVRKNFAVSEIVDIIGKVEETRIGHRPKKNDNLSTLPRGPTREIVAKLTGFSEGSIQKLQEIKKATEEKPEDFAKIMNSLDDGKLSIDSAHKMMKLKERPINLTPIPDGKFNIVEIDFNWGYGNSSIGIVGSGGAEPNYETKPPKQILEESVPFVKELIADDAVVAMWVTTPLLNEIIQLKILEALGCEYKTMITWKKKPKKKIFGGRAMGYYFQVVTEHCIIGIKGNIPPFRSDLLNFFETEVGEHSEKPIELKKMLEDACKFIAEPRRIDIYGRQTIEGWARYGNQEIIKG